MKNMTHGRLLKPLAVIMPLSLFCLFSSPASALSVSDYFSFTQRTELDSAEVAPNEIFHVDVYAHAVCIKDLPLKVVMAEMTGKLVAIHGDSGERVELLNYTYNLCPFPVDAGSTVTEEFTLEAAFPDTSAYGDYKLVAELVDASVQYILWVHVTGMLPEKLDVGSITLTDKPAKTDNVATGTSIVTEEPPSAGTITAALTVSTAAASGTAEQPSESISSSATQLSSVTGSVDGADLNWWEEADWRVWGIIAGAGIILSLLLVMVLKR